VDDLSFARAQMAMSLGFHILFAVVGVAMPALMVIAEVQWRRTGDEAYRALTRAWSKGTAVLFAVGAVSGTVLSFELGLLFPGFMRHAGAIIGMPFSLEGIAFFTEAVFLGIYLYGWRLVPPVAHVAAGVGVAVSGLLSAVFVTLANAWMNAPRGFRIDGNGHYVDIDPIAAMTTPFALHEILHMVVAAYMTTGFAVAAVHAFVLLREPRSAFHRRGLGVALVLAVPFTLVQPLVGDLAGKQVARYQPEKLAAMELLYRTTDHAPLHLGGFPDPEEREARFALALPGGLSFLAYGDTAAVVRGLEEFPHDTWPHPVVHYAFQVMVGVGGALAVLAVAGLVLLVWRRRLPDARWFLLGCVAAGPLAFLALEAGWVVTEVGRQPWIIYGVQRTADAVTPVRGLWVPFTLFTLVYLGLSAAVLALLARQVRESARPHQVGGP